MSQSVENPCLCAVWTEINSELSLAWSMSWKYYGWSPKTLGGTEAQRMQARWHLVKQVTFCMPNSSEDEKMKRCSGSCGGWVVEKEDTLEILSQANQIRKVQTWEPQVVWGKRAKANDWEWWESWSSNVPFKWRSYYYFLSFIMFLWKETASLKEMIERWSLLKSGDDWRECEINTQIITTSWWSRRGFWVLEIEGRTG